MTAACTAPHCARQLREHELTTAQQLCDPCIHRARDILASIPAALTVLHGSLQRERRGDTGRAGTRTAPTPGRLDVLNLLGPAAVGRIHDPYGQAHADQCGDRPLTDVLIGWVRLIVEERHVNAPASLAAADLAGWLTGQLTWSVQQPWAGEYVGELRDLDRVLRGIMRIDTRTRPVPRPCPSCDLLYLSQVDWDRYIRCSGCGGCWTVDELNDDAERRAAA
ncbi:hypothetical protein [Streptomyces europaeiscabiei]|uniref:hypothetical protein n=1 Tax=Streptomyces europaeiscabiei TaxID=146819 RepID=UPI0029A3E55A|nr:hypothetical protein [Streptomyces europaeiscabiei]MDX2528019.1 hypothetical protein [Streptomyces europaeiscabiei]MDX2757855.1 hypothetical protein [Streptomyces europaeiscabiei]